eukprot:1709645-Ditylum_brightwellii.AAC.1
MDKYVGCKVNHNLKDRSIKITTLVLLQSYADEFEIDMHGKIPRMPAETGNILTKDEGERLNHKQHKNYQTGVRKLLHMSC